MSEARKKPEAGFWSAVVLTAVLVLYPLSIGPITWLYWNRLGQPPWMKTIFGPAYFPIEWACAYGPDWFGKAVIGYCNWWMSLP